MTRPVIYMCHPVAGDVKNNIARALRWLAWLRKSYPKTTFIAPWIAGVLSVGGDGTPEERKAGLLDDCTVVALCAGAVLVGGRVSSGMLLESQHTTNVYDLTHLGDEPPAELSALDLRGIR